MKNKIFIITLLSLLLIAICSYSFATNNMMNSTRNAVGNAGNSVGNAVTGTANAVVNGAKNLGNGVANMANDMTNADGDTENDATNTLDTNNGDMLGTTNGDYTATRTATADTNMFGLSDTAWTWLILGIVGAVIVSLVWYYGAQYNHRNYNND